MDPLRHPTRERPAHDPATLIRAPEFAVVVTLLLACAPSPGEVDALLADLPPADLTDPKAPEDWAGAYTRLILQRTWAEVDTADFPFDSGRCPVRSEKDDGTVTWTGDCVEDEDDGDAWYGTLTVTADRVVADGFGTDTDELFANCDERLWGTVDRGPDAAGDGRRYTIHAGAWTQCRGFFGPTVHDAWVVDLDATTFGDGTAESTGTVGIRRVGTAEATTSGFRMERCDDEPEAGSTTVRSEGHTLLYRYGDVAFAGDGTCTSDGKVPVALDGESLGKVDFPVCATGPGTATVGGVLAGLLALRPRPPAAPH